MKGDKNYKLPSLSVWDYLSDQKEKDEFRTNRGFSLHRELLTCFKPGPSTRYFICQLWNITNTCQMFNNPALLCLSLSNNTLLGAWFREAIVLRVRIGGKTACQEREKEAFTEVPTIPRTLIFPSIYRCHSLAGGISSRECSLSIA